MTRSASGRRSRIIVGILVMATGIGPGLSAQARARAKRPMESAAVDSAATQEAWLEPAQSLLHRLIGVWHYEIWFAGNFDGPPDATGTRVVKPLFDSLRVEWTEEIDHSQFAGRGVVGFDPVSGRFFSTATYSGAVAPEVMSGVLDNAEPLITFQPVALAPESGPTRTASQALALNLIDENHFTLARVDRAWRGVFTRQQ